MRINTKVVIDMATNKVIERESFEGPDENLVAQCCGGGPGGGGGDEGGESAAGIASGLGEGEIGGAAPAGETASPAAAGYGGGMGIAGAGEPGGGMSAPGTAAGQAPAPGVGFDVTNALNTFGIVSSLTANPVVGLVAAGIVGLISGSDGLGGDGSTPGDVGVHGPDPEQRKRATAGIAKDKVKDKTGTPSLAEVKDKAREDEEERARKRPSAILTSPMGLRSKPSIRKATLLGG